MKLTDYVAEFLSQQGIKHVFGLTGGAVLHLFDSVARHPRLQAIFNHHEQAAAFAAQAYARARSGLGAAFFTTGPGGTNALTGLCAAWLDSIPCIYISGQARLSHTTRGKPIRQLGTQQLDIISIVSHMTKYAVMVEDAQWIRYYLEKAVTIAQTGRPGPVWIDLPLDLQWALIEPEKLKGYDPSESPLPPRSARQAGRQEEGANKLRQCLTWLQKSERPLVLAGYGIRLAHAGKEFKNFITRFRIPFLSTWNASDLLPTDHPLYVGRPGMFGQRGANLAIQNCDLLLAIGSHLSIPVTGSSFDAFARGAKIVMVNVDQDELDHRTVKIDLPIPGDARIFLQAMLKMCEKASPFKGDHWRQKCRQYKNRYNGISPEWRKQKRYVNPYVFMDVLSDSLNSPDTLVVDGGGTVNQIAFQSLRFKTGQRVIISAGLCSMGSGLPESIGACFAKNRRRTICLCGDGSMQLNIQELQTIAHQRLPIKIFVLNNQGYLSIRHTQGGFLENHFVGADGRGGLSLPDILKVAKAYGIQTMRIQNQKNLRAKVGSALNGAGPVVCELMISPQQDVCPRQGFDRLPDGKFTARPFEDMYPYLERKEFLENMLVAPW